MTAPEHVAFVSWGNDSVALVQWLYEHDVEDVVCAFSNTGWAAPWWKKRLDEGRVLCDEYGYGFAEISSIGMANLVRRRKGWPMNGMQFCTEELKIKPALEWLDEIDPSRESICVVGVRREESARRAQWPEWVEESDKHAGRSLWSPLVRVKVEERNALIERAGFDVLPHRSMECYPCVNANRADLRMLSEGRIKIIDKLERELGYTSNGKPRVMFRPGHKGGAVGIRQVKAWADSEHGQYEPVDACEAGWCGG